MQHLFKVTISLEGLEPTRDDFYVEARDARAAAQEALEMAYSAYPDHDEAILAGVEMVEEGDE